jgi:hypothetical protein
MSFWSNSDRRFSVAAGGNDGRASAGKTTPGI